MGSGFKDWAAGDVLTANDVDGYLMRQSVMTFADASARDTALSGVLDEGMCAYLEDTNEITVYDGTNWLSYIGRGYSYVQTVYFTSSGTFTKATYPWLRAARVKVMGAGGGAGGSGSNYSAGAGGGAGGYAEAFITNVAGLSSSETVTVGAGGSGGVGNVAGASGTDSTFGGLTGGGGDGGNYGATGSNRFGGAGGSASGGDINISGGSGGVGDESANQPQGGLGGSGVLGYGGQPAGRISGLSTDGGNGGNYGGGGGGGARATGGTATGGSGAGGIVILELFA